MWTARLYLEGKACCWEKKKSLPMNVLHRTTHLLGHFPKDRGNLWLVSLDAATVTHGKIIKSNDTSCLFGLHSQPYHPFYFGEGRPSHETAERLSTWKDEGKTKKRQNHSKIGHSSSFGNDVRAVCLLTLLLSRLSHPTFSLV